MMILVLSRIYLANEGTRRRDDDANEPKRRQTRRLGYRCVFLCFFYILMMILVLFRMHLDKGGTRRAMMMQTSPNDARRVVWAIGASFYFSVRFLYILMMILVSSRMYLANEGTRRAMMTQTSPNDARHVVWAIGVSFYVFYIY
jgi:hypothetical protein